MKGLIYKDFMCLRKNMRTFALVTLGMVVIGVMFLLSSQYGNLAVSMNEMMQEEGIDSEFIMKTMGICVWFLLMLPICFITDVAQCFREDTRVGFGKALSGMALSHQQIVGSRYLTTLIYGGISLVVALFCAGLIALVPVKLELGNLFIGILTITSAFLLYMSFNLFMIYLCGARRADLIQMLPLVVGFIAMGMLVTKFNGITDEEMNRLMLDAGDKMMWFLQNGYKILIPASVVGMFLSYAGSVAVLKRRRRVL